MTYSYLATIILASSALSCRSATSESQEKSVATATYAEETTDVHYVVVLNDDVEDPAEVAAEYQETFSLEAGDIYRHALKGFALPLTAEQAATTATDPRVAFYAKDKPVVALAQSTPTGLSRIGADRSNIANIDGSDERIDVDIAVIDTGVDLDHSDLNVFYNQSFIAGETSADDNNGHGTHVAGIAGALDNEQGVVGVAPGARIWALKVLDADGRGFLCDVLSAIDFVTANSEAIEVVNISLALTGEGIDDENCGATAGDPLHQAICGSVAKGVAYVVAAGNDGKDVGTTLPAAYDEVVTVSAIADSDGVGGGLGPKTAHGDDDTLANFSNFGPDIDFAAPGVAIESTWPDGDKRVLSGTSMAAPHVAGVVALYLSTVDKPQSQDELIEIVDFLRNSAIVKPNDHGFTGDKDKDQEPVIYAAELGDPSDDDVQGEPRDEEGEPDDEDDDGIEEDGDGAQKSPTPSPPLDEDDDKHKAPSQSPSQSPVQAG